MNEYKIKVNLERGLIIDPDIHLVQNDYNSTVFNFEFGDDSYVAYTKIFQLQYPDGTIWKKEIKDNKVTLANFDEEGNPVSILTQAHKYYFDIAVYDNDSKLTTTEKKYFNVREEITGEDIELDDRLPVLDDLINTVNKNLNETDNLDIDIENSVITITKKDGTKISENVKGEPGQQGRPGSVKTKPVNEFPTDNIEEDAIYILPNPKPTSEKDKYLEYVCVNGDWELFGGGNVGVDLTDYVKKTDVAKPSTYENGTWVLHHGTVAFNGAGNGSCGVTIDNRGVVVLRVQPNEHLDKRYHLVSGIVCANNIDYAVKIAMCDGKGAEWTEEEKIGARNRMGVSKHITLTQEEYDALETKDENTYYNIVEE